MERDRDFRRRGCEAVEGPVEMLRRSLARGQGHLLSNLNRDLPPARRLHGKPKLPRYRPVSFPAILSERLKFNVLGKDCNNRRFKLHHHNLLQGVRPATDPPWQLARAIPGRLGRSERSP